MPHEKQDIRILRDTFYVGEEYNFLVIFIDMSLESLKLMYDGTPCAQVFIQCLAFLHLQIKEFLLEDDLEIIDLAKKVSQFEPCLLGSVN